MDAIQFKAYSHNGMIEIPKEYQNFLDKELSVILLITEDSAKRKELLFQSINKHAFELPADYQFDRNEMNER
jgi:hypothetical protein